LRFSFAKFDSFLVFLGVLPSLQDAGQALVPRGEASGASVVRVVLPTAVSTVVLSRGRSYIADLTLSAVADAATTAILVSILAARDTILATVAAILATVATILATVAAILATVAAILVTNIADLAMSAVADAATTDILATGATILATVAAIAGVSSTDGLLASMSSTASSISSTLGTVPCRSGAGLIAPSLAQLTVPGAALQVTTGGGVCRVHIAPQSSRLVCRLTVALLPPISVLEGEV